MGGLITLIIFLLLTCFLYSLLQPKFNKDLSPKFRFTLNSITIISCSLLLIIGLVIYYYLKFQNEETVFSLTIQSLATLLATFVGVLLPLSFERYLRNKEETRSLMFMLTLVLDELRKNKFVVEQIKNSYLFNTILQIPSFDLMIYLLQGKSKVITNQSKELSNKTYIAGQSSGLIRFLRNDDEINKIRFAYDSTLSYLLAVTVLDDDINLKIYAAHQQINPLTTEEKYLYRTELECNLRKAYQELIFLENTLNDAISTLEKSLGQLNIKTTLEERILPPINAVP